MADVENKTGESAATTQEGRSAPKKPMNKQRKSKGGGSRNVAAPPIPAEAGMSKPAQTHKVVNPTKPRNEPMFDDLDIAGFNGMSPYCGRNRVAITTEGFIPLVEKEYTILATKEPGFGKMISRSMFIYYCVQHLYARLVYIKKADLGDLPLVEENFLEYMNSGNYSIPDPIKSYINGIGVVTDASGVEYKIEFPAWPNRQGHFGRVGPDTHYKYASLPAPAVLTERIRKDLDYNLTLRH